MINELTNVAFYKATDKAMSGDIYKDLGNKVQNMSKDLLANTTYEKQSKQLYDVETRQLDVMKTSNKTQDEYLKETNTLSNNLKDYEKRVYETSHETINSIGYNFDQLQEFMENDGISLAHVDDSVISNLVSRMRSTIFSVEMVNSYNDIVEPLLIGSKLLHDEHMSLIRRLQWENTAYAIQMLETLQNIRQADQEVGSSLFLQMRQFMRQPVWYTLGQAAISLLKFTGSTLWAVMFGRNKTVTIQEKILKATKEQTEFLRTGQIIQQQGFFTRLLNQGIAGMPLRKLGRTLLSEIGIDKQLAQQRESEKSVGGGVSGGFRGKISDMLFRDEITKLGREKKTSTAPIDVVIVDVNLPNNVFEDVIDAEFTEIFDQLSAPIRQISDNSVETVKQLSDNSKMSNGIFENMIKSNSILEMVNIGTHATKVGVASMTSSAMNLVDHAKKTHKSDKNLIDVLEDVEKHTKVSAREQKKLRRQLFLQNMMKFASSVIGNILQMGNMIVNAIKLLGVALAGKMLGGIGKVGIGGLLGKGAKVLGPIGLLAAAGYGAYSGLGKANDHFGLEGELDATIGQKLSSALGGIADTFTFGLMDSGKVARAIHGFGQDVSDKIGGMFTAARDYIISDDTLTEKLFMNPLKGLIGAIKEIPTLFTTIGKEMINSLPIVGGMKRFREWFSDDSSEKVDYKSIDWADTPVPSANIRTPNQMFDSSNPKNVKSVIDLKSSGLDGVISEIKESENNDVLNKIDGEIKNGNGQLLNALNKLIDVVSKSKETSSTQFSIGHDDLTYQNVYGAN